MVALSQLAAGMGSDSGISCRFECPERVLVADNRVAMHLYRIAQEAVTNALKHGRPGQVLVKLEESQGEVVLSISDDGAGMPSPSERKEGAGLRIMRYRAAAIAATLKIKSAPGGGTLVRCEAPRSDPKGPAHLQKT
jgi:signal transduction histidine kinase